MFQLIPTGPRADQRQEIRMTWMPRGRPWRRQPGAEQKRRQQLELEVGMVEMAEAVETVETAGTAETAEAAVTAETAEVAEAWVMMEMDEEDREMERAETEMMVEMTRTLKRRRKHWFLRQP